ncbi:MAG: hypothetical protein AAB336_14045 [Acidobacteriota bacterium]
MNLRNKYFSLIVLVISFFSFASLAYTQNNFEILSGEALKRIVPTSFYFAGQSAETQLRNSAAAKIGKERFIIVGLVDTSGYSTDIQGKYEGFFITDSPVKLGNKILGTGAYGFGFSKETINIFDLSSKQILAVKVTEDTELKRPRPLMMTAENKAVKLYKGKLYISISPK